MIFDVTLWVRVQKLILQLFISMFLNDSRTRRLYFEHVFCAKLQLCLYNNNVHYLFIF